MSSNPLRSPERKLNLSEAVKLKDFPELKSIPLSRPRSRSSSPVRRSGSPVRRQHIAEIEQKSRNSINTIGVSNDSKSYKRIKSELTISDLQNHIDQRLSQIEDKLQNFMDSVNKRLLALEQSKK